MTHRNAAPLPGTGADPARRFGPRSDPGRRWRSTRLGSSAMAALAATLATALSPASQALASPPVASPPDFGPNVHILSPEMSRVDIQTVVDGVAAQQLSNEFGPRRDAVLFKPGVYGSAADPLNFQVGYYTAVAGLGRRPSDVVVSGSINVYNQCKDGNCIALNNFWRSLSNLSIEVNNASFGCYSGEFWAVSQASPMRRVRVNGNTTLMDYCTGPSFASGGFIADSEFVGAPVINGSQQQWMVRNSKIDGWSNGVWNQVFSGVVGAPATCFPADAACGGPYTTLPTSPVTREAPYLYINEAGLYKVFVPAPRRNASGTSWGGHRLNGLALPIEQFFIAKPTDGAQAINAALAAGKQLLFTPGIYLLDQTLRVRRPGTVVLGLGFPTLIPQNGVTAMTVADVPGVDIAGVVFDAGPVNSPVLLRIGSPGARRGIAAAPTALQDVFFRIGGAAAGKASLSLEVNSDHVILDNIWAWRADHGNGVGWTVNTADTGVIVNGDHVTAYGLFVEHYQKTEAIWNGNHGHVAFFQNEMPYDPPSQAAWTQPSGTKGWPALKVADGVSSFRGFGMGSYTFFNQGVDIFADRAFEVPTTLPAGSLSNMLTIFLDPGTGKGGVLNVVNDQGGSSTIANPDVPVTVVSYP